MLQANNLAQCMAHIRDPVMWPPFLVAAKQVASEGYAMTQLWLQAISSACRHVLSVAKEAQLLKIAPLTNNQLLNSQ
jgi:hypothetical protein